MAKSRGKTRLGYLVVERLGFTGTGDGFDDEIVEKIGEVATEALLALPGAVEGATLSINGDGELIWAAPEEPE